MSNKIDKFTAMYQIEDGYCGGSRPQYCDFSPDDLEDDMDDDDLEELFFQVLQADMEMKVSTSSDDLDKFKDWARQVIDERDQFLRRGK